MLHIVLLLSSLMSINAFATSETVKHLGVDQTGGIVCSADLLGNFGYEVVREKYTDDQNLLPQYQVRGADLLVSINMAYMMCLNIDASWKYVAINLDFSKVRIPYLAVLDEAGAEGVRVSSVISKPANNATFIDVYPTQFTLPLANLLSPEEQRKVEAGEAVLKSLRVRWGIARGYYDLRVEIKR